MKPRINEFASFELTDEEYTSACQAAMAGFNLVIQNQRAAAAGDLINVKFDPEHVTQFAQDQAFLQGKLAALAELLDILDTGSIEI